jgi:IMP dehydrogenase
MLTDALPLALTFDDVLLLPAHSTVLPGEVDVATTLSPGLRLRLPLLSSAMDTVTEAEMAIAMAREGGLGVIHKNLSPQQQAAEEARVKKAMTGVIGDPVTLAPAQSLREARRLMRAHGISGLPVVQDGRVVGIGFLGEALP